MVAFQWYHSNISWCPCPPPSWLRLCVFEMMIIMLFFRDLSEKKIQQKILRSKNFKQNLRQQVVKRKR